MKKASVVIITDGFAKGITLNVEEYTKKWMNEEAYAGFDMSRKVLFSTEIDKDTFNSRILKDFT